MPGNEQCLYVQQQHNNYIHQQDKSVANIYKYNIISYMLHIYRVGQKKQEHSFLDCNFYNYYTDVIIFCTWYGYLGRVVQISDK